MAEVVRLVRRHAPRARVVVDGVAFAPHRCGLCCCLGAQRLGMFRHALDVRRAAPRPLPLRRCIDVQAWGVDFYVYSVYKVRGSCPLCPPGLAGHCSERRCAVEAACRCTGLTWPSWPPRATPSGAC